ncbi:MAG TPA: hypothetical protein VM759_12400 [Longimicrobium sp.]|nr:hypothetical protein [Longimicrobium sp.]
MITTTRLGFGAIAIALALAPVSFSTPGADGAQPLVRLSTACAQEERTGIDGGEAAAGCVKNTNYICETSHEDHIGYKNN